VVASNNAVIGGTGAFVGVRGQLGAGANTVANRQASITEDPRNRRNFGGGKFRIYVTLYPMAQPEVIFPVHRARAGETLSILMTGLGPTRPGVNPGTPFPADPPQVVNSPIEVIVNERQAEVLAKVGVPGTTDVYRVDIRVPEMTERGTATMQVNVAFIAAQPIRFAVH
jgi:uncharacterized protein (TIGR03437 family)